MNSTQPIHLSPPPTSPTHLLPPLHVPDISYRHTCFLFKPSAPLYASLSTLCPIKVTGFSSGVGKRGRRAPLASLIPPHHLLFPAPRFEALRVLSQKNHLRRPSSLLLSHVQRPVFVGFLYLFLTTYIFPQILKPISRSISEDYKSKHRLKMSTTTYIFPQILKLISRSISEEYKNIQSHRLSYRLTLTLGKVNVRFRYHMGQSLVVCGFESVLYSGIVKKGLDVMNVLMRSRKAKCLL